LALMVVCRAIDSSGLFLRFINVSSRAVVAGMVLHSFPGSVWGTDRRNIVGECPIFRRGHRTALMWHGRNCPDAGKRLAPPPGLPWFVFCAAHLRPCGGQRWPDE